MKKNYFYPETETVQLKGCGIICTSPKSDPDPMHDPDVGGGGGFNAPSRKGLYM